ncbi:hypothetical protein SO802_013184 [Lithocarpus litseifolius]|uniref:Uncharacterized protein n=1 Tax=Lithocarpus litseifolius TaxID=425828 RepID=A0AAW2D7I4_9ROSI
MVVALGNCCVVGGDEFTVGFGRLLQMFMVVAMEGCCGGDGDGFAVGLRRNKMESIGAGNLEKIATKTSTRNATFSTLGCETKDLHFLPSANLNLKLYTSLMMKPHDGDARIKKVLDVPTKSRTRRPPLSKKDRKWSHVGKFSLAAVIKHRELRKLTPQQLEERKRLIEEKRKMLQISRDYSFLFTEEGNAERDKIKTQTQRTKCYFRWDNTNSKLESSLSQKGSQDLKHNGDRCDKVQDFKANTQKASQQSIHHVNRSRFHNHNGDSEKVQDLKRNSNYKAYTPKGSQEPVHHVNQTHNYYGDRKIVEDWNRRHKVDGGRNYKVDTQRISKEFGHHRIHRMSRVKSFDYRRDLDYTADITNIARIDRKDTRNCWESENAQRKRKREIQESMHMPRLSHCY